MAAQYGQAVFVGASRRVYTKNIYFSDSAGALVNWDSGAGASSTSEQSWVPPENVVLRDLILAAATTQTRSQVIRDGIPSGDILMNSVYLASIVTRPPLSIPVRGGSKIAIIQLA